MKIRNLLQFHHKVYSLARPYGRRKLALVFLVMVTQGLFQVAGVSSVFPFLAMASNPSLFRESRGGQIFISLLPEMTDTGLLILAGWFAILMLLASSVLNLGGEIIRTRYTQGFGHWLRLLLLKRIVSNPYSYFLQHNTGILLKKTTGDVMSFIGGILAPLMEGSARLITVVLLLSTLLFLDAKLSIIAAACMTLYYIGFFKILKRRRKESSDAMKGATRGAMMEAQQLLGGIKPVKVHGKESQFIDRYARHSHIQTILAQWIPVYRNSPRYFIEPIAFGGLVVLVVILAAEGHDFNDLIPKLGVMALAGYRLIPNFQLLYGTATGISLMMYSLDEVYDEFKEVADSGAREEPLSLDEVVKPLQWEESIRLEEVSFAYRGSSIPTIRKATLEIPRNQFVAFIGQTGSGKTTLVDILLGLHQPQSGKILIDGRPLEGRLMRRWRAGIGYVPQDIFLLDDTVYANIAFGINHDHVDMKKVRQVARVAQIANFVEEELEEGYNTVVGERGVRLSGGQRQRIGLARALYHDPGLLVLDEATSALDTNTETALMQAIGELYGQLTIVVIAHRLTTVRKADIIYELKQGKIARQGTFKDLGLDAPEPAGLR